MADRREFLQYAMASAVPLGAAVSLDAAASARGVAPTNASAIPHVVVDARHGESLAFGADLARGGATVHRLADGDATDLWQSTLAPAWRSAPVPVAGLTRAPALFILEQLGWMHGLRVVHHVEHVLMREGRAVHRVLRALDSALASHALAQPGPAWPAHLAALVARSAPDESASRPGPTAAGLLPTLPPGAQLLTSWIIAPA